MSNPIKPIEEAELAHGEDPWKRAERILLGADDNVEQTQALTNIQRGYQERLTETYYDGYKAGVEAVQQGKISEDEEPHMILQGAAALGEEYVQRLSQIYRSDS